MNKELKVGIFVTSGVALLVFIILLLGDFRLVKRYNIKILFDNISGVPVKSNILQNGVKIGNVSKIDLQNNKVIVTAKIYSKFVLHKGATAKIISPSIIGSKLIEITDGDGRGERLEEGSTINGKTAVGIEQMLDQFSERLNDLFGKKENGQGISNIFEKLNTVVDNLKSITAKVDIALGKDGNELKNIIDDISDTIASIKRTSDELGNVIVDSKGDIKEAFQDIKEVAKNLNDAANDLKKISDKINKGEGIAGELISDKQMAADFKETIVKIKSASVEADKILKRASRVGTEWYYSGDYNTSDYEIRNTAGITLTPNENKFYTIKVENINSDNNTKYDKGNQAYNSVTFIIGKKVKNLAFYGGAIRSSGGFGINYKIFRNNRLQVTSEVFKFDRQISGQNVAWVNAGLKFHFTDWLSVRVIKEDIIQNKGISAGLNLEIKDEDLAYLFGFGWLYTAGK